MKNLLSSAGYRRVNQSGESAYLRFQRLYRLCCTAVIAAEERGAKAQRDLPLSVPEIGQTRRDEGDAGAAIFLSQLYQLCEAGPEGKEGLIVLFRRGLRVDVGICLWKDDENLAVAQQAYCVSDCPP